MKYVNEIFYFIFTVSLVMLGIIPGSTTCAIQLPD